MCEVRQERCEIGRPEGVWFARICILLGETMVLFVIASMYYVHMYITKHTHT